MAVAAVAFTAAGWRIIHRRPRRFTAQYRAYITSPEWRKKANRWKAQAGYRCERCLFPRERHDLHAHHKHYRTFGRERRCDVEILCARCHRKRHRRRTRRR